MERNFETVMIEQCAPVLASLKPAGLFQTVPLLINFVRLFLRLCRPQAFIQVLACRGVTIVRTVKGIHTGVVQFVLGTEYALSLIHI